MHNIRLPIVGFFFFLFTTSIFSFAENVVVDSTKSSVWIDVVRPKDIKFKGNPLPVEGIGAGVVLPSYEVVTAAHVVSGATKITVANADGLSAVATIVAIDENVDIAILDVSDVFQIFSPIRSSVAVLGEGVHVVLPRNLAAPVALLGKVDTTHYTVHGVDAPLLLTSIKGEKGMSGGGMFDATGKLVGIVVRIHGTLGYLSALPIAKLCTHFSRCAGSK